MANAGTAWSLVGQAFSLAFQETGRAIVEVTHDSFTYLADKTAPDDTTVVSMKVEGKKKSKSQRKAEELQAKRDKIFGPTASEKAAQQDSTEEVVY